MLDLRTREGIDERAMEFTVLTAARAGEATAAQWHEFDMKSRMWVVPAHRMKGHREHKVPLSDRAIEILEALPRAGEFLFVGKSGRSITNQSVLRALRRMGRADLTTHGFRSTFRDWAADETAYPSEVVEMALAHAIPNKAEAAYRRGDLLAKRRKLMEAWASYCFSPTASAEIVSLQSGRELLSRMKPPLELKLPPDEEDRQRLAMIQEGRRARYVFMQRLGVLKRRDPSLAAYLMRIPFRMAVKLLRLVVPKVRGALPSALQKDLSRWRYERIEAKLRDHGVSATEACRQVLDEDGDMATTLDYKADALKRRYDKYRRWNCLRT